MEVFFLILVGLIGGLVAGLMGVGGGIIFTPVLFFLFDEAGIEHPVQWSVASGLLCTFVAAGSSTIRQYIQKNMFWKEGLYLGLMGVIGITLGKWILTSEFYDRQQFAVFFSAILFYAAYMMFRRGKDASKESERLFSELKIKEFFVTGGVGGFIASLAGVGGGGIMVPIMNLLYRQPFRKAVSVSQLGMVVLIFSGLVQLALVNVETAGLSSTTLGYIDIGTALPLAFGGLVGGFGGVFLNHRIKRKYLQWGFALLAFVMAGRLLWSVFN